MTTVERLVADLDKAIAERNRLRATVKRLRRRAACHRYYLKHRANINARRRAQDAADRQSTES